MRERITNLGFGDAVPVFRNGVYAPQMVAGSELRQVDFFLDDTRAEMALETKSIASFKIDDIYDIYIYTFMIFIYEIYIYMH